VAAAACRQAQHVAGRYRADEFLAGRVALLITQGLTAGEQMIVLATASNQGC